MADGSVKFDTKIDSSGIKSGLAGLGKIALAGVGAASTAISGLGTAAVKTGMEFDSAMSQVAATMGTTVDKISDLREKAKEMGAATSFSATEAAQALNYLALAGYDADKQMEALPTVLNLAAAGSMDLAYASDLVTDSMSALGLETSELTSFADKMAKTASKANTSVAQLGEATLVCGGQAKLAGMSVTDMNTALGILADNGIKGSEGGTALRNVLKNLYTPTQKQADALEALGIKTANADGSLREVQDVLKDLSGALGGLTEDEKMKAMANIFDTRTIAGANALLNNSTKRWDELSEAIDDSADAASKMAATQLDNLEGDVTILKSAFEGLQISISDELSGTMRDFVQLGTEQLGILNDAMKEGGFSGFIEAAGTVLGNVVNKIVEFAPTVVEAALGLLENLVTTILDNSGMLVDAAVDIILLLVSSIASLAPELIKAAATIISQLAVGLVKALPTLITTILECITSCVDAIVDSIPVLLEALTTVTDELIAYLPEFVPALIEAAIAIAEALLEALPEIIPVLLEAVLQIFNAIVEYLPELIALLVEQLPLIIEQVVNTLLELLPVLIEGVMAIVNAIIAALPQIITMICDALPTLIDSIVTTLLAALPQLVECGITLFTSLIEALPEIITAICEKLPEIIDSIITSLLDALPLLIDCGIELFVALVEALPEIIATIIASLSEIIDAIIEAVIGAIPLLIEAGIDLFCALIGALPEIILALVAAIPTIIGSLIESLLGNIGLFISAGVDLFLAIIENLPQIIIELLKAIPKILTSLINGLLEGVSKFFDVGVQLVKGLWEGIKSLATWLWDKVSGWISDIWDGICDFFGIESPSKLFKNELGKNLMLGLAAGIDAESSTAVDSMAAVAKEIAGTQLEAPGITFDEPERLYSKVADTVTASTAETARIKAAIVNGDRNYTDEGDGVDTDESKPQYIENIINIDGKVAGRVITPYVAKELDWRGK